MGGDVGQVVVGTDVRDGGGVGEVIHGPEVFVLPGLLVWWVRRFRRPTYGKSECTVTVRSMKAET